MTLFKTIEELRELVPVSSILEIEKVQPYLVDAAEALVIPHIGQELFDKILNDYNSDSATGTSTDLLRRIRIIVARFGLAAYLPIGAVIIGNDGITTVGKGTERTAAYDVQVNQLTDSLITQAYDALERLLTWLQASAQLTAFPEYASSEEYTRQQRGLIRRAVDFNDIYHIGSSRLTFSALHPELLNVEEDVLIPLIGLTYYNTIRQNNNLSDLYASLRRSAQKAIVFQAVSNVIRLQQNIQLDSTGLRVYHTSQNGSQNVKFYRAPTDAERNTAAGAAQARADFYWDSVSTTLAEIINPDASVFDREILSTGKIVMF